MKDKKVLIISIIVLLILVGGGVFFFSSQNSSQKQTALQETIEENVFPTIMPSDIGLLFTASPDKRNVIFTIEKADDIEHIEYEITYDALSEGNSVQQGLNGEVKQDQIKNGQIEVKRILGTCSTGGKCRYDEGVTSAQIVMKITKTNGKTYQVEKSINI